VVSKEKLRLRAVGLELLGEVSLVSGRVTFAVRSLTLFRSTFFRFCQAYQSVSKPRDPNQVQPPEEFVKVDTKESKERDSYPREKQEYRR
jgi:hypothetical protein